MAEIIKYRFRVRRRTAANWTSLNEVLLEGEFGLETDTGKLKMGNGSAGWNARPYIGSANYIAGNGIDIDFTDPDNPVISSNLAAISLSGRVANYAALPGGLGGGDAGDAYYVEADGLVYIWDGTAWPASGTGVRVSSAASGIDAPPAVPTAWDDEFDFGSSMDTAGARRPGANAWVMSQLSGTAGTETIQEGVAYCAFPSSSGNRVYLQAAPSGDFAFQMKLSLAGTGTRAAPCLCFFNSANGRVVLFQIYSSPTTVIQRGTLNTSTWAYTFSSNTYTSSQHDVGNFGYIRLAVSGSNIVARYSALGYTFDFTQIYSEAISSWIGAVTHVGIFESAPAFGIIEYFRRVS